VEIGIDSFVATTRDALTGEEFPPEARLAHLLDEIKLADELGLDVFGIGEHHRAEFLDSAPEILLAAAAAVTQKIRLTSAVTVLSAHDLVRVFQQFATIDLLSRGRVEMVVGRCSFIEAFPLFGLNLKDYDALFAEKLDLLLQLRKEARPHWSGRFRPPLQGQGIFPRPLQKELPVWLGVGGTPESFVRAGRLGLPLMVAIIGGQMHSFRPLIDLYREAGEEAGHRPEDLRVGIHALGYLADSDQRAADEYFPGYLEAFSKAGKERGWPPITRQGFEAIRGRTGALLVSEPGRVVDKILWMQEALGGVSRLTFQMTIALVPHCKRMRAIELLGTKVAPFIRKASEIPPASDGQGVS
jgi:probable LLM family oxidoreductase